MLLLVLSEGLVLVHFGLLSSCKLDIRGSPPDSISPHWLQSQKAHEDALSEAPLAGKRGQKKGEDFWSGLFSHWHFVK